MADEEPLLAPLSGAPIDAELAILDEDVHWLLVRAVTALNDGSGPPAIEGAEIVACTENRFPTAHSGVVAVVIKVEHRGSDQAASPPTSTTMRLFLKKVTARAMAHKKWFDRRKTLSYARTEARFYQEFAPWIDRLWPKLKLLPRLGAVDGLDSLDKVLDPPPPPPPPLSAAAGGGDNPGEPDAAELATCGSILVLECAPAGYWQCSPVTEQQAVEILRAVARFHAACWEDRDRLAAAADRLQRPVGGAFSLKIRSPAELEKLRGHWDRFVGVFRSQDPTLFAEPRIQALGERLYAAARWVSDELTPGPDDAFATLMHGDLKAMNAFLPPQASKQLEEEEEEEDGDGDKEGEGKGAGSTRSSEEKAEDGAGGDAESAGAMLIDFASCGVGYGMSDLGMLLSHSVSPAVLDDAGAEGRLIDAYLDALAAASSSSPSAASVLYPRDVALRHYKLAVVDYGRFVIARFWKDASPETFAARAGKPNTTLVNRDVPAALAFVRRIDACLTALEQERQTAAA